jgi:hypothetical protein
MNLSQRGNWRWRMSESGQKLPRDPATGAAALPPKAAAAVAGPCGI